MKNKLILALLIALIAWLVSASCGWASQTNVIFGQIGDLGLKPQGRVNVTLHLVSPVPRYVGNIAIWDKDMATTTDAGGSYAFTNVQWGTYTYAVQGAIGTVFKMQIYTNDSGNIPIGSRTVLAPVAFPSNATNFYTIPQVDALVWGVWSAFTNGIAFPTSGTNGVNGRDGAAGKDGTNGVNGATGATGATGPQGATGSQGPKGDTGASGTNGVNGVDGITPDLSRYVTNETIRGYSTVFNSAIIGATNGLSYGAKMITTPTGAGFFASTASGYVIMNAYTGQGAVSGTFTAASFAEKVGGATLPRATNMVVKTDLILVNSAAMDLVDFAQKELTITGDMTFVGATNWAADGQTIYLGATVDGVATIDYPAVWSPNSTHPVTVTNALVAFKSFGTNIYIGIFQP